MERGIPIYIVSLFLIGKIIFSQECDLSSLPKSIITQLTSSKYENRIAAIKNLKSLKAYKAKETIMHLAKYDSSWKVRQFAVQTLGQYKNPKIESLLLDILLQDPDWDVREASVKVLRLYDTDRVFNSFLKIIQNINEDPNVKIEALRSLTKFRKRSDLYLPLVEVAVYDDDYEVREVASIIAKKVNYTFTRKYFLLMLRDNSYERREAAAYAFGAMKEKEATKALVNLVLRDGSWDVRHTALYSLIMINDPLAISYFMENLRSQNNNVRDRAINALELLRQTNGENANYKFQNQNISFDLVLNSLETSVHKFFNASVQQAKSDENPKNSWRLALNAINALFELKIKTPTTDSYRLNKWTLNYSFHKLFHAANTIRFEELAFLSPTDFYSKIYYLYYLKTLYALGPKYFNVVKKEIEKYKDSIARDLLAYKKHERPLNDSVMTSFSIPLAALSLDNPPTSIVELLEGVSDSIPDFLKFPYYPEKFTMSNSRRASAARNIMVYLVLYLYSKDNKKKHANRLFEAVKNYDRNKIWLMINSHGNGAHKYDGITPYYFYPSLPFYTAAIKLLKKSSELHKKAQLNKFEQNIIEAIKSMYDREIDMFVPLGSKDYPDSKAYCNAFAGLSILPLLSELKGVSYNSLGILSPLHDQILF